MKKIYIYIIVLVLMMIGAAVWFSTGNSNRQAVRNSEALPNTPITTSTFTDRFEIYASDAGNTFSYDVTSRFGLVLDQNMFPKKDIKVSCAPADTIGQISNIPSVPKPMYALRYEGVAPGVCTISDGGFHVTVQIK